MVTTRLGNHDQSPNNSGSNPPLLPNPPPESSHANPSNSQPTQPEFQEFIAQQMTLILSKIGRMDTELDVLKKGKALSSCNDTQYEEEEEVHLDGPWWSQNPHKRPYTKVEFSKYEGGDPRGCWVLKAEKYFRYYQTPEYLKVDVVTINLEGDALDVFTWVSSSRTIRFWEQLVEIFQEQFGLAEFQNPDLHLCGIK